jgi:type II secretory pathway pseudopilin PulG
VRARLGKEEGFGLVELLMAILMLNIGILAIVAAFSSSSIALRRASRVATASALADAQMELYRALKYDSICPSLPAVECDTSQSLAGADSRTYGVDTYISQNTPTNKLVTIVVREVSVNPPQTLVRVSSTFDEVSGR